MPKSRTRKPTAATRPRRAVTAGGNVDRNPPATGKGPTVRDLSMLSRLFWMAHRNRVELAPVGVAALLFGTAEAFYKAEAPGLGVATAATLAGMAWWGAPQRLDRDEEILFVRVCATAAAVWLIVASIVGPVHPVALWSLFVLVAAGAVPWYRHKLVRPTEDSALLAEWQERWNAIRDRLGLEGSEVVAVDGDADYAEIVLQLVPGVQSFKDVQPLEELIAGALGEPAKSIKVRDMRKVNASRVRLIYRKVSAIDSLIRWEEVAPMLPAKATDPAVLGRSETGEWKRVSMLGHWMIVGTTRAGKSNEIHTLMANITGLYDPEGSDPAEALVFFVDLKGGSVGARWKECIDWAATDLDEAVRMLEAVNGMINARAASAPVGDGDGDQLVPSPERPAVFIVFDECAEGLGVSPGAPNQGLKTRITNAVESIARRGAAMNFYLVLAGQDGSLETYGTEKLRGNLSKRLCFRVAKASNAQYVLDNYTKLDVTELEDGQFYYHERTDDPVPIRGPFMTPEGRRTLPQEISRRNARRRPQLDAETARGGGDAYATRDERRPAKFRFDDTPDNPKIPVPASREDEQMAKISDQNSPEARARRVEAEAGVGTAAPVTPADLAKVADRIDLAKELGNTKDLLCAVLVNAPVEGTKAKAIYEAVGVSRSWMYDRLGVLESAGLVEQPSRGFWRARLGVEAGDLREAIDAWEADRRDLVPV